MDRISPYWPSLVYFCIHSQYLLLNGINGYGSLRLVPIVEQMARHCMPFSLILAETFIWPEEHARNPSSVLGLMGSPHLLLYIERVTVSLYMLYVPLWGLTMSVAYHSSRVARQYGRHQATPDYTRFEGGLITQRFLSRFISTWRSRTTVPISDVVDTSSLGLYRSWLQAYSKVSADSESADLLTTKFLLGPGM
ncbi:hypothetical protein JCGZ_03860 [Jatropha curcas]|uniref:Aminotransferase-like plant mobile domain-containing protein n=1 Tax=Jatropha curcas TaxID=180498 RepID=A0A067L7G3_JATCU|nr:hypothetical protein JCGZ_03860 [Jatropha curcas]